jgi:hypothetical protein
LYPITGAAEGGGADQLRLTECATEVPVPLNATTAGLPLVELLVIVSFPVAAPAAVGANCTFTAAVCEALRVNGKLPPMIEKAAPVMVAELTVTAELPDEVSVNDSAAEELSATLPKLSEVALTVSCGVAAVVPVPLRAMTAVAPLAELLLIVSLPVAAPVAVGVNLTCSVRDWFGFNVSGKLPATRVKPVPVTEAELIVSAEEPDEVIVSDRVAEDLVATLPKLSEDGLADSCGFDVVVWGVYTISTQ